jgi:hypothetical protein
MYKGFLQKASELLALAQQQQQQGGVGELQLTDTACVMRSAGNSACDRHTAVAACWKQG